MENTGDILCFFLRKRYRRKLCEPGEIYQFCVNMRHFPTPGNETKTESIKTANNGNKDANVTTPNPEREEFPLPAAFAIPIPSDNTKGTVTGPVVTAPQSQAKPSMLRKLGSGQQYAVKRTTGSSAK